MFKLIITQQINKKSRTALTKIRRVLPFHASHICQHQVSPPLHKRIVKTIEPQLPILALENWRNCVSKTITHRGPSELIHNSCTFQPPIYLIVVQ